jgi:hypothetical protein
LDEKEPAEVFDVALDRVLLAKVELVILVVDSR